MRRGEKADVGGKLESAKKCDKKEEGGDYQPGPSETLQREKEEMETRLKEIATAQKKTWIWNENRKAQKLQLIKLDALKIRRFTNKILTNCSLEKIIFSQRD